MKKNLLKYISSVLSAYWQLWFHEKRWKIQFSIFEEKSRQNTTVMDCLLIDNFDLTRKIQKFGNADFLPRGIMETFSKGSAYSRNQPVTAWPASWYATVRFSSGCKTCVFFSKPAMTLSMAASKCLLTMDVANSRAAIRAASLHTLAMSAPVNPGVKAAIFRAKSSLTKSVFNSPKWTLKIEARPWK